MVLSAENYELILVEDNRAYFVDKHACSFRFNLDNADTRHWYGVKDMPTAWSRHGTVQTVKVYFETDHYELELKELPVHINEGKRPWLMPINWVKVQTPVMAGTTLGQFIRLIAASGGTVYVPVEED